MNRDVQPIRTRCMVLVFVTSFRQQHMACASATSRHVAPSDLTESEDVVTVGTAAHLQKIMCALALLLLLACLLFPCLGTIGQSYHARFRIVEPCARKLFYASEVNISAICPQESLLRNVMHLRWILLVLSTGGVELD